MSIIKAQIFLVFILLSILSISSRALLFKVFISGWFIFKMPVVPSSLYSISLQVIILRNNKVIKNKFLYLFKW